MRRARSLALLIFSLQLALPAAAQTNDPDLQLLASQLGSAPNVMILFDTSGSMKQAVWQESFNPKVLHSTGSPCSAVTVYRNDRSAGQCPASGYPGDYCPENDAADSFGRQGLTSGTAVSCTFSSFVAGCADIPAAFGCVKVGTTLRITLPDVDLANDVDPSDGSIIDGPNEVTYWAPNYIHWFMKQLATTGRFPTNFPLESRKMAAKRVIKDVINEVNPTLPDGTVDQRVRFGLARMHTTLPAGDFATSNGGFVVEPIANNNKATLLATLRGSKIAAPDLARTPLSESLIDVARYFAGNFLSPLNRNGFGYYPVYNRNTTDGSTTASPPASPIAANAPCRENFVIVVTDGEPKDDANDHYGSAFNSTFGPDYDNDGDSNNAADFNDTLDDVAFYLAQNDLINDSVMPEKQNIVTYTIGFALDVNLLRKAADKGDGEYFTASTGAMLADHLRVSLEDIVLRAGSFTAAAVPASRSTFGDGFYTTYFEPQRRGMLYRGHLQSYRLAENFDIVGTDGLNAVDPITGEFYEPRTTFFWDAALTLADPNRTRSIFFTPATAGDPNAFTPANISAANLQLTATDLPKYVSPPAAPITNPEQLADALVSYVRGIDRFDEDVDNNVTELRSTVLGDIFHSSPRVVGPPPLLFSDEEGYGPIGDPNSFLERYARRDKLIYAGANDGMLHAFNAGTFRTGDDPSTSETEDSYYDLGNGVEKFGFVPRSMFPTLKQLTLRGAKPSYVDGAITVADAWLPTNAGDTSKTADEWTTALVVGMRNGGESYLALDITDPSENNPAAKHGPFPKLLWELNDAAEPLGRTWSRAVITRVRLKGSFGDDFCGPSNGDGASGAGQPGNCREEWVAIFGAGYLEQGDPNVASQFLSNPAAPTWEDDSKGIFIVSLQSGAVLARASYTAGSTPLAQMLYSFPSEPAVLDLNFDGFADVIYIGDTGGQLWKWDISSVGQRDVSGRVPLTTWPVNRFFVAPTASNGHKRSFFYPPAAAYVQNKLVLGIGTGERTNAGYRTTGSDLNRYYVIEDRTPTGTGAFAGLPLGESNLTPLVGTGVDTNTADYGFYLTADRDEKFVSDSLAFGGFVITASYIPKAPNPAAPCEGGGQAILYIFSLSDGKGFFPATDPDAIDSRRVSAGAGLPASASITISGDKARVVLQTSDGRVVRKAAPDPNENPVDLIYWQQDF